MTTELELAQKELEDAEDAASRTIDSAIMAALKTGNYAEVDRLRDEFQKAIRPASEKYHKLQMMEYKKAHPNPYGR
jgi:hypothetical protein